MNKNKICEADADHLERGLISIFKDSVNKKIRKKARGLYYKFLGTEACPRKRAVNYALWEMAKGRDRIHVWASAMQAAYAKKSKNVKKV